MIDDVTPYNPVWLNRSEGHQYLANSLALAAAGVTAATPDVAGGTIMRYTDEGDGREPTGLFIDNALSLVYRCVPCMSQREADAALEAATRYVHAYGVTSIHHMVEPADRNRGGTADDLLRFESAAQRGRLRIRVYCAVPIQQWSALATRIENAKQRDDPHPIGSSETLRWGAIKGYTDGSLGSATAAFFKPYVNRTDGYCGDLVNTTEDLLEWVSGADRAGLQVRVCQGSA